MSVIDKIIFSEFLDPEAVKKLNRYLAVAALCLAVFVLWSAFFNTAEKKILKILNESHSSARAWHGIETAGSRPEESAYEASVSEKTIFKSPSSGFAGQAVPSSAASSAQESALKDLVLVGVLPGETPQAVLEDRKAQKTYYLSPKQSTDGITVEEIHGDTVTLDVGGETRKMSL